MEAGGGATAAGGGRAEPGGGTEQLPVRTLLAKWPPPPRTARDRTENGVSAPNEADMPVGKAVQDTFRVNYYK